MSVLRVVIDRLLASMPAPVEHEPAAVPDPEPTRPPVGCRCGCLALQVRAAHLEDQVARLTAVLGAGGGSLPREDT